MAAVINRTEVIEPEVLQGWLRRKQAIQRLTKGGAVKDRIRIYQFRWETTKDDQTVVPFVHSKLWIFDDEVAIIGSANCNRRRYSHDGEVGVAISGLGKDKIPLAKDLRIRLWLRNLNQH